MSKTVISTCDHGAVVNALKGQLAKAMKDKCSLGNDREIDIYLTNSAGQMTTLFEVKTSLATQDLYCGVGQLMIHGAR